MTDLMKVEAFPLGSTIYPDGVNFSFFCKNGTSVSLLFFDHVDDIESQPRNDTGFQSNQTYHYWHMFVPGAKIDQLYGYRIEDLMNHRMDIGMIRIKFCSILMPRLLLCQEFQTLCFLPARANPPSHR